MGTDKRVWEVVMQSQWLAMEHYRLHAVETWPDGPRKDAVLSSIRSKLASFAPGTSDCPVCHERISSNLVEIRQAPAVEDAPIHAAA